MRASSTYSRKRACTAAGLPHRLLHDSRRTVVRNLVRSGVDRDIAMTITGHASERVFSAYNIVDEKDQRDAVSRLSRYIEQQDDERRVVPLIPKKSS